MVFKYLAPIGFMSLQLLRKSEFQKTNPHYPPFHFILLITVFICTAVLGLIKDTSPVYLHKSLKEESACPQMHRQHVAGRRGEARAPPSPRQGRPHHQQHLWECTSSANATGSICRCSLAPPLMLPAASAGAPSNSRGTSCPRPNAYTI